MVIKIIFLSLFGGLLCLDRVLIQTMISRPIIIAPVIGFFLNNLYAGLIIGAMIELFWIDRVPIGIYVPPNDSIAAVIAVSLAIIAGQQLGNVSKQMIALSILISVPFALLARIMDTKIIESNNILSDQALENAKKLDIRGIERKMYRALGKVISFYVIYLFGALIVLIPLLIWIYPKLPKPVETTLLLIYYFIPLLGIAAAINTIKLRGAITVFCAIFLAVVVTLEFFHVF